MPRVRSTWTAEQARSWSRIGASRSAQVRAARALQRHRADAADAALEPTQADPSADIDPVQALERRLAYACRHRESAATVERLASALAKLRGVREPANGHAQAVSQPAPAPPENCDLGELP
jgi:hypothetical protein